MFQQVHDFQEENKSVSKVLADLGDSDYELVTQFKDWTFDDVIQHLHFWNIAADLSLSDESAFENLMSDLMKSLNQNSIRMFERDYLGNLKGIELFHKWEMTAEQLTTNYEQKNPKDRVRWAGPEMSVRSSITARQMETWAHSQSIFDRLGLQRINTDRINNIVILGLNTFSWSYKNRRMTVPENSPRVELTSPSGKSWLFNENARSNRIQGNAVDFCQVVTQVRNIQDTDLEVHGKIAEEWMSIAQCFAGPPEDPPKPGKRYINEKNEFIKI